MTAPPCILRYIILGHLSKYEQSKKVQTPPRHKICLRFPLHHSHKILPISPFCPCNNSFFSQELFLTKNRQASSYACQFLSNRYGKDIFRLLWANLNSSLILSEIFSFAKCTNHSLWSKAKFPADTPCEKILSAVVISPTRRMDFSHQKCLLSQVFSRCQKRWLSEPLYLQRRAHPSGHQAMVFS